MYNSFWFFVILSLYFLFPSFKQVPFLMNRNIRNIGQMNKGFSCRVSSWLLKDYLKWRVLRHQNWRLKLSKFSLPWLERIIFRERLAMTISWHAMYDGHNLLEIIPKERETVLMDPFITEQFRQILFEDIIADANRIKLKKKVPILQFPYINIHVYMHVDMCIVRERESVEVCSRQTCRCHHISLYIFFVYYPS